MANFFSSLVLWHCVSHLICIFLVLRIDASGVNHVSSGTPETRVLVTTHGEFEIGMHKWHGAAASADGTIVSVPANADNGECCDFETFAFAYCTSLTL